ncbi:MAG: hypothetical protein ABI836_07210 [Gemmatimonadota bacterium]
MIRRLAFVVLFVVPAAWAQDRPAATQIAAAVLALPDSMRAGAGVLGYQGGKLVELRRGTNDMICLADNPADSTFQASCYHKSLEPFMARGRALRAQGLKRQALDSARAAEVKSGALAMPGGPAALYSVFGKQDDFDPAGGMPAGSTALDVIYLPYATTATTGISTQPSEKSPWLMHPGEYRAHVMIPVRN